MLVQGSLVYEVIGDGVAPAFFAVDSSTGLVTVYDRSALLFDRGTTYAVSVTLACFPTVSPLFLYVPSNSCVLCVRTNVTVQNRRVKWFDQHLG